MTEETWDEWDKWMERAPEKLRVEAKHTCALIRRMVGLDWYPQTRLYRSMLNIQQLCLTWETDSHKLEVGVVDSGIQSWRLVNLCSDRCWSEVIDPVAPAEDRKPTKVFWEAVALMGKFSYEEWLEQTSMGREWAEERKVKGLKGANENK